MVSIVPVAIGSPFALVFIPPAMPVIPAMFPRFVQIVACPTRLPALKTVMLNCLMQTMVRLFDAVLTIIVIRAQLRHGTQRQ